jgi:hypothetical protein
LTVGKVVAVVVMPVAPTLMICGAWVTAMKALPKLEGFPKLSITLKLLRLELPAFCKTISVITSKCPGVPLDAGSMPAKYLEAMIAGGSAVTVKVWLHVIGKALQGLV